MITRKVFSIASALLSAFGYDMGIPIGITTKSGLKKPHFNPTAYGKFFYDFLSYGGGIFIPYPQKTMLGLLD